MKGEGKGRASELGEGCILALRGMDAPGWGSASDLAEGAHSAPHAL